MICTLLTPLQAEKIHTERFSKFPSDIYSILFDKDSFHLGPILMFLQTEEPQKQAK